MHTGFLAGGIVLLAFGVGLFIWSYNEIQDYQSFIGQVGRALLPEVQAQYQELQSYQIMGALFGVAGIVAVIYGAAKK